MNSLAFDGVLFKPVAVAEWEASGTKIVLDGKIWLAEDWKAVARFWSTGVPPRSLEKLFEAKGYTAKDLWSLVALMFQNQHILPPIERALFVLAGMAARDADMPGGFRIHTAPVAALDVVFAANRILASLALPLIRYPNAPAAGGKG
jgi:hypothetical protein